MVTGNAGSRAPAALRGRRWRSGRPASAVGASAGVVPVRTRRSWGYTAAAVAAIVVGGMLSAQLYTNLQHTTTVFVTSTVIDRGTTITAQDLGTLQIAAGQPVSGFTPDQASQVLGKTAAVTLPKGSLLTTGAVTGAVSVPAGMAVVGVALKLSQMPSIGLHAGDRVVLTPIANQNTTVSSSPTAGNVPATVSNRPTTDPTSGLTVVNVEVSQADAGDLAGRAAAGLVALYLAPGTGE